MVALAKGKLSYYVLSCLAERDMYGLELIEQIKNKFGIEIKLPSLYSNLNRMKELKFVSTYLKESNKGPKCSYSSITEKGRVELASLKETWENDDLYSTQESEAKQEAEKTSVESDGQANFSNDEKKSTDSDYDDYFSLPDNEEETTNEIIEEKIIEDSIEDNNFEQQTESVEENIEEKIEKLKASLDAIQSSKNVSSPTYTYNDYVNENVSATSFDEKSEIKEVINKEPEMASLMDNVSEVKAISELKEECFQNPEITDDVKKDDYAKFNENKKLFDITQDFSKYKKRKSFTENQMVMNVNTVQAVDEEKKQSDIYSLKQTLQNSRDGNYDPIDRFAKKDDEVVSSTPIPQQSAKKVESTDDGLFITDRIPQHEIPKAKKIETAKLSFTVKNDYQKYPAPRRDTNQDPNLTDVKARLQKLYEKSTAATSQQKTIKPGFREYETFDELKEYYTSQEIEFKVYDKPEGKVRHNTNKLLLFVELILFGIVGISSLLFYLIFNTVGGVNQDLSFLYYLFPVIALVVLCYKFYNYKLGVSRIPKPMLKDSFVWIIFLLGSIAIFCFSVICGLNIKSPITYCTAIIYPILILGVWLVARHYLTRTFYQKYWR